MTKAVVVCYFRYTPRNNEHYRTQSDVFFRLLKENYADFDTLYLVDAGWDIPDEQLHPNTVKVRSDFQSHWWYLNKLTSLVKEDAILYLDPDTLLYNSGVLRVGFSTLQDLDVDIMGILDNSGTREFFPPTPERAVRKRFTPYMTFLKRELLSGINVDFTPTSVDGKFQYDSMGKLTEQILQKKPNFLEMVDDRTTLRLLPDGTITKDSNLDGPGFSWSEPLDAPRTLGYYHVRNSSVGLSIINEFEVDQPAFLRRAETMPFQEVMRLLSWQWIYDKVEYQLDRWKSSYLPVLEYFHVSEHQWNVYIEKMEKYHSWIKGLL